ncbi:MAG: hypothetical protein HOV79_11670 [Hamadaea sp.]|nr:hypothetical protein [Hamadaea sp.]
MTAGLSEPVRRETDRLAFGSLVLTDQHAETGCLGAVVMFACLLLLAAGPTLLVAGPGDLRPAGLGLTAGFVAAALLHRRLWRIARERAPRLYAFDHGMVITRPGRVDAYPHSALTWTERRQTPMSAGSSVTIAPLPLLVLRHGSVAVYTVRLGDDQEPICRLLRPPP